MARGPCKLADRGQGSGAWEGGGDEVAVDLEVGVARARWIDVVGASHRQGRMQPDGEEDRCSQLVKVDVQSLASCFADKGRARKADKEQNTVDEVAGQMRGTGTCTGS
jgi:hypothetical protein